MSWEEKQAAVRKHLVCHTKIPGLHHASNVVRQQMGDMVTETREKVGSDASEQNTLSGRDIGHSELQRGTDTPRVSGTTGVTQESAKTA